MIPSLPLKRWESPLPAPGALRDRVVLIAGATGGLGRAAALACARAGSTVILAGRKVKSLEAVYDEIEATSGMQPAIYPINFEGASPDDYLEMADAVQAQCGRLDAVVHAAVHFDGLRALEHFKSIDWIKVQQVCLNAPFLLTQACLPLLKMRDDAAVVFIHDDPVRIGKAYWGSYGVAKAGLAGLSAILHQETDSSPVRVHGLLPPPMRTGFRRMAYFGENTLERDLPDAAGDAIAFLASAGAADLRGHTLDLRPVSDLAH